MGQFVLRVIYPLSLLIMAIAGTIIAWPRSLSDNPDGEKFPLQIREAEIYIEEFVPFDSFIRGEKPKGGEIRDITSWREETVPELASGIGYATYWTALPYLVPGRYEMALEFANSAYDAILMPRGDPERAIKIRVGKPGRSVDEEIPFLKRTLVSFHVKDGDHWELFFHLSNFHRTYGGLWAPIRIAPDSLLSTEATWTLALDFAIAGSMIIIMFYTYMLFNRRPSDLPALFLSLTCLAILMRIIGIENLFSLFRENVPSDFIFELATRMEYGSMALATLTFLEFLRRTFERAHLPNVVYGLCHGSSTILILLALFTPTWFFTQHVGFFQANVIVHVLCMIVITSLALKNKEEGAGYMLASALIPLITAAVDVFHSRLGGASYVSHIGGAFFIFLQSQILAKRFAKTFEQVAHLSQNLQNEVKRQTLQIRNIMDNVPEGLFTIGKDLKIRGQTSLYVEVLFPKARMTSLPDLLSYHTRIDRSSLDMTISVLLSVIGEDSIAWDLNSEHLFTEIETHDDRLFSFQWHPIIHGDKVDEMLVIVRDSTELRNLRQQTLHHEQEMVLISALAKAKSYYPFRDQARTQLAALHSTWASHRLSADKSYIRVILTMLHTLKGNARQIGFTRLARDLHDFEQSLIDLRETHGEDAADFAPVLEQGLRVVESELKLIDSLHRRYWGDTEVHRERHHTSYSERFLDRWQDLKADIRSIAESLGKKHPEFKLSISEDLRLSATFQNSLFNVLGHLLRNAIDHGIESKADRRARGKIEQGLIKVGFKSSAKGLMVTVEDDGQGLDVDKLLTKAGWNSEQMPSQAKFLELVFQSGITTAKDVSEISGRGIGMDAVRREVEALGGKIELVPKDKGDTLDGLRFIPFRVVMTFSSIT